MKGIAIYSLLKSHQGYVPSDIVLGRVFRNDEGMLEIDCPSSSMKDTLSRIFGTPIYSRIQNGEDFGFSYSLLHPSSKGYLEEMRCRLRKHGLWGEAYD